MFTFLIILILIGVINQSSKIMKKLMLFTLLGTFLINSYGQIDTLEYSVSGKCKYEFDRNAELKSVVKLKNYKDFKFKLKKDEFLYLDLFDDIERDTLYLLYRDVTVYYRDGYVENIYFSSDDNTITVDGSLVKKVIAHKPEKISENLVLE